MGKRKIVSSPRTHVSKPYPRTEGSQYEEDGMEHLDQEVRTCVNMQGETYLLTCTGREIYGIINSAILLSVKIIERG